MRLTVKKALIAYEIVENVALDIDKGRITHISRCRPDEVEYQGLLTPGFIDVQVNGGGGVLFNQTPNLESLIMMANAHLKFGTTGMMPTLITDQLSIMQQAADAVAQAISEQQPGILGIHFEGPHLSVAKKGVHNSAQIRSISEQEMTIFARQDLGIKMITLAPESVSIDDIKRLVALNVIVCLGHSNADYNTVQAAISAGATGFTHLFNAMSPLTSRSPGMVGAVLECQQSWCGIIADGHHVHPAGLRLAHQCKQDKLMLVTDAMSLVGTDQTSFQLLGDTIIREHDKLTGPQGQLAGSMLDMAAAVNYCHKAGIALTDCLTMASQNPAHFLHKQQLGSIAINNIADLVLLDEDTITVNHCWQAGKRTYSH